MTASIVHRGWRALALAAPAGVRARAWFRDPLDTSPQETVLSSGLRVAVCP